MRMATNDLNAARELLNFLRGERPLLREELNAVDRLIDELGKHRCYLNRITDGGMSYPEDFDYLMQLGLVVEVKPTQEYIDEWGADADMWVLAWSPLATGNGGHNAQSR
jgi:hypothetical protein